jgi:hypothetical protein
MTKPALAQQPHSDFLNKAYLALNDLFERAKEKDELNFALSLAPEFKAYTLTSAMDATRAYKEYGEFLELEEFIGKGIRTRIALALYCHTAEAAGLWGIPMCMLGVLDGQKYNTRPFEYLVQKHKVNGRLIAPNANKVMGTMAGCADTLGLHGLAQVFRDAFDPDIRNGFAHADYALSIEGVHVRGRHDAGRIIGWSEFQRLLNDGIGLFDVLGRVVHKYQTSYQSPKIVSGSSHPEDPVGFWIIHSDPRKKTMSVSGGPGWTREALLERVNLFKNDASQ